MGGLDAARLRTLQALCDTYVAPARAPTSQAADPTGYWDRTASDVAADGYVAAFVTGRLRPDDRDGLLQLLDLLGTLRFAKLPHRARGTLLRALDRAGPISDGLLAFRQLTMLGAYGRATVPAGGNPNWRQFGYPGPPTAAPQPREPLSTHRPPVGAGRAELRADVVVVGSGAGGAVVAGRLAAAGRDVVVLEAGGDHQAPDFPTDETTALDQLYWRGAPTPTSDGNVALIAAATLGGGPTVNWQNCVRPPAGIRAEWATRHGLDGLDGPEFDGHLDAVTDRIGATRDHSEMNGPNLRLRDGAEALGWSWNTALRNVDPERYTAETAGHTGHGDRFGTKLGTIETYLVDASGGGARIVTDCRATRILTRNGSAAGVEALLTRPEAPPVEVTVHAPTVVVAGGALETPALLLRSGVGGPATGRHLRVHPVVGMIGIHQQPQSAWWGPPQTCIVDEHAAGVVDGHGFLVETPAHHPAIVAATLPWRSARDHKRILGRWEDTVVLIAITREHGDGTVTIDRDGEAVLTYPLDDPRDRALLAHAGAAMARLHAAAGAEVIVDFHPSRPLWRRGDDLDEFVARVATLPVGARGRRPVSAHQMGTARMGTDAATSVADPDGQVHTTPGAWIGDTSAFPSALGANPMLTCMALAHRTADRILAATAAAAGH